ncbi:MAG TPA: ribosome maturation factor RimM [Burkholderiales bacterium]
MGRVAGSYGVRGWIKVAPGGGVDAATLAGAKQWWIGERAHEVAEAKVHSAAVVARLVGIENREQALELKGAEVSLERTTLPQPDEGVYYLADLVGLEVLNEQGERLGRIARLFSNGAQDVMELTGERTRLIPWVAAIVKHVDLAAGQVVVAWNAQW